MIPIYEQGQGKGIGHSSKTLSARFADLCEEHLSQGRAKSFAFIFYDFLDRGFQRVLRDQGVFAQIDRLSGSNLSVFYLHSGGKATVDRFNSEFLSRLGLSGHALFPCVVFFKLSDKQITDVTAVHLESADVVHGFHELQSVISEYISESSVTPVPQSKSWRWIKSTTQFIGIEAFRAALKVALSGII